MADPLDTATRILADLQMQLEHEGYAGPLVTAGLERARSSAAKKAAPIRPEVYNAAFLDLLVAELRGVRSWLKREHRFLTS